jgi:Cu+-exporting ATPase
VRGRVEGRDVVLGRPALATELGADLDPVAARIEELEAQARTVVVVVADGTLLGALAIADPVKPDAAETVAELLGRGIEPVMLTGDNERTARAVADRVGIREIRAQVLPEEKAARARELQQAGHRVAMVGDGINDAPALMQADIGIAIGAGTDIAIESSDVILVGERLSAVIDAWGVGRGSYRRTKQNLVIAFLFNGIGVPAASTGLVHPVWAMAAMATSVTTVLLNSFGLRVFHRSSYRRFADPAQLREEQSYHDDTEESPPAADDELAVQEAEASNAGHAAQLTVHVTGVHFGSCMVRAAAGVQDLEGVVQAHPLPRLGDLAVEYLPAKTDPAAIAERLEQLGFGTRDEERVR